MSDWYRRFREWGDSVHAELQSEYGYGLGDMEAHYDLGTCFEEGWTAADFMRAWCEDDDAPAHSATLDDAPAPRD